MHCRDAMHRVSTWPIAFRSSFGSMCIDEKQPSNVNGMTANKKVPALRFKEFDGEWEEKKLGEMCSTFKSGNSITGNEINETGNFRVYGGNGEMV